MDGHLGEGFTARPENVTEDEIEREFQSFLDEELNQHHLDLLQEYSEEIVSKIQPAGLSTGVPDIGPGPSSTSVYEHDWRIHREERYNRTFRKWIETMTEIRSLQSEREKLVERYETLGPRRYFDTLLAVGGAAVLSVGAPLLFYFFRVIGFSVANLPLWVEPFVVSVAWIVGGGLVFAYLWTEVSEEVAELPDVPDVAIDEDTD